MSDHPVVELINYFKKIKSKVFHGQLRETSTSILQATKHCLRLLGPLSSKIFYLKTKLVQWIIKIILPLYTGEEKIDAASIDKFTDRWKTSQANL